ncbi:PREDICTED: DNA-directed RNA polymerase, mitochondrial [Acromyrmex echinatior]|uniref:DNA-directed RNA polymerase n=1 Tax=Acromyrmex echinatior TaxID=103372 RepID=F4WHT1_ACREC|nr:PREDICTED: DNA-directed RNA polymerase, mitochondrial [Acromyrmex echinatior]EGI66288.1 DNA-directed RNA polymerase, mitochondrial [Acromyrmex echinatior]
MLNFLRTRTVSMNARIMSARPVTQSRARLCSFCNFHHLSPPRAVKCIVIRCYATTDTVELRAPLQKKTKRRAKKYAELLEVTDQTTNNRKAAVSRLSSAQMSVLVDQPNITLDKLHKIPNFKKEITTQRKNSKKTELEKDLVHMDDKADDTYAIPKEFDGQLDDTSAVMENLKESGVSDQTTLIKDSSFLNMLQDDKNEETDNQDDTLMQIPKYESSTSYATIPFTNELDSLENRLSGHNLISQLLAHIDVYIQINMPHKAFKLLTSNKNRIKKGKVSPVSLYNLLLKTHVSNAHVEKAFEIYRTLKEDSVQPNFKTYALMFEIIVRIKNQVKRAENVAEMMVDMNHNGISFDQIINTSLNATQRNAVLHCMKSFDPNYCAQSQANNISYNCNLMRDLTNNNNWQSPAKGVVTLDELRDMMNVQINIEKQCTMDVKSVALFTEDPEVRQQAIKRVAEWEKTWKSTVTEAFERNLTYLKQKETKMKSDLKILYPFLQVLSKEEYIKAIMNEINQLTKFSEGFSHNMTYLYLTMGQYIYKRYEFQRKMKDGVIDNSIQIYKKYLEWYTKKNPADRINNGRIKWQQLVDEAQKSGMCCELSVPEWSRNTMINVGKFLYNIIVNDVKIPHVPKPGAPERQIPAFYLLFRLHSNNFFKEEIKPHPQLYRFYKDAHSETLSFETILLPIFSPPRPWVNVNTGGYLLSKAAFVRDPYMKPSHLLRNTPTKQLYPVFDCLNQLGSIPWKINIPMLDILIQIFRDGGSKELNVPQPSTVIPSSTDIIASETNKSPKEISKLLLQFKRMKNEMHSLWCDCLYKLSLANHFRDKVFWMPHNLDFRGRAYPVPPHLTHLSSDLGRSILMFAQGKPLGSDGLDWLKIHAINMSGLKKREPMYKRLEFANEILDLIVDSARNPLTGKMWWTKADEPWQTLATCKEIDNALQSPNVEKYICRLPIHQDGSCNGLQHYAALGRDLIGAKSVNLYPSDRPQDVYSVVAKMVDDYRKSDADAGDKIAQVLEGHISRKVMKQTVMTTVYGVTKFGARLQIARQLSDLKDFDQTYIWSGSMYLVEKTFMSLQSMFESAKEIQNWFTDCARTITIRCNQYVQWVTPLGLPVIQPYSKHKKSNNSKLKIFRKLDTVKQKNAFAPNFIHSLDSSHMMLTSLYCEQAGITFMSVHDCFWTHPCTVDIMNRICREQFIALHSEPILEDLSEFFHKNYRKQIVSNKRDVKLRGDDVSLEIFQKIPKKGTFDINMIKSSRYFFN